MLVKTSKYNTVTEAMDSAQPVATSREPDSPNEATTQAFQTAAQVATQALCEKLRVEHMEMKHGELYSALKARNVISIPGSNATEPRCWLSCASLALPSLSGPSTASTQALRL
jgi:hypothetical protein